ncbi:LysM peptidoglycan-binding domain-containing protein [Olleya sp. YS]|uniref:LysM peptidoglycan-binding domain-containing protein n=1 Tax=Olleya sp. YS TaxID=3028318 RepID=UPI00243451FB|nr:LysM peptidoglycan-binding domain-containing protein [Olleya sp. YS]WGD34361.1 LysM peptidoglycan-binding domain-containing protein [Olleya sp. YS]
MKKLIVLIMVFNSFVALAQDHIVEIMLDGKPAFLNTKTGETKYTNGKSTVSYSTTVNSGDIIDKHTVEKGDTLYSISKKYGISMAHIKSINNLKSNVLKVNQVLNIGYAASAQTRNTSTWTVVKGDTLYSISKKTGVSVSEIKKLNSLDNNIIVIGQQLTLK